MREEHYMFWLASACGLSHKRASALLARFGSAEEIFHASEKSLSSAPEITPEHVNILLSSRDISAITEKVESFAKRNIRLIPVNSPEFPERLKQIYDPPLLLYVMGKLPSPKLPAIAVIGSRNCSDYGLNAAYKLSKDLAARGVVIVSGMARGIDGMAHKGAMDALPPGEKPAPATIAVLGSGVDVCYPPDNQGLYERMITKGQGCVVSEYPPGTEPLKQNFPQRNRIISGLSLGVIVVEAAARSGTSITVDMALEQGRDVFVVPGSIFSRLSEGTNKLIQAGAATVTGYEDVLWAIRRHAGFGYFGAPPQRNGNETEGAEYNRNNPPALAKEELLVYSCISLEPVQLDEIVHKTSLDSWDVQYILTKMELAGHIKKLSGQKYVRVC